MRINTDNVDSEPKLGAGLACGPNLNQKERLDKGSAFSQLSRELSDDDLNASGAKKLILSMLDTLTAENDGLKVLLADHHEVEKNYAVLKEKYKALRVNLRLWNILAMLGTLCLGGIPWLIDHNKTGWWIVLDIIIACILIALPYAINNIGSEKVGGKDAA